MPSATKVDGTPSVHHITVRVVNGSAAVPHIPSGMRVGDTVKYVSPDGQVTVFFPNDSPFLDGSGAKLTTVTGAQTMTGAQSYTLQKAGKFQCQCSVMLPNGNKVGWPSDADQSGGETTVGHK